MRTSIALSLISAVTVLSACGAHGNSPEGLLSISSGRATATNDPAICREFQEVYDAEFRSLTTLNAVTARLDSDFSGYGLKFLSQVPDAITHDGEEAATWKPLTQDELVPFRKLAATLAVGFKTDTPEWFRNAKLDSIIFVSEIVVGGTKRSAMPDIDHHAVWYNPAMLGFCRVSDEEVMHHEFYHVVEAAHHGTYYYKDPSWAALNPTDFAYGAGGASAYNDPNYQRTEHPRNGFVTGYATYGLEEDKAETYGWMKTPSLYEKVMKWARFDNVLKQKVAEMQAFIDQESGSAQPLLAAATTRD